MILMTEKVQQRAKIVSWFIDIAIVRFRFLFILVIVMPGRNRLFIFQLCRICTKLEIIPH